MSVEFAGDGINWSVFFSDEAMETRFLGQMFRVAHSRGNQGNLAIPKRELDHATGYALSEAAQLSPGRAQRGASLVLSGLRKPQKQALMDLISDDPEVTDCEACGGPHAGIHMEWKSIEKWTEVEADTVARAEYLWKRCFERMALKGWVRLERPQASVFESDTGMNAKYANPIGKDGLPKFCRLTPAGLDEAERRIPGTKEARGPFSYLSRAPQEVRDHAAKAVAWAHRDMKKENSGTS